MKSFISATALVAAISMTPALAAANNYNSGYDAHERCKSNENNRQVLGGLAGAVVGGVVGSQVSGNGARTEGSAIGAVLGGLAGAGIADKTVDCDPVYSNETRTYGHSQPYQTTTTVPAQTTQYGSSTYGSSTSYGSSQPYYEDRTTVSTHPVYSDPYYGAGAVSQGTTYSSGTVSYPPSGSNSQYVSRTYQASAPVVHSQPAATTTRYYSQAQPAATRVVYSAPQPTYSQPNYTRSSSYSTSRPYRTRRRTHHHGRYSCDMGH